MRCLGCYKEDIEGYCATCRRKLFGGKNVAPVLSFDPPKGTNLPQYLEQARRLSISGGQLKYSVRLEGKELVLAQEGGQYILKPVPPIALLVLQDQAPENEHLTMQIARQVFSIPVAANALIYFKDGTPAYITRRFDVKEDGTKVLQEDFAQLSGRTKPTHGDHFKYDGTYEEVGRLVRQYVAAYPPVLEAFFKLVLFNYLFSNGDAHLKNFSLVQTEFGDYTLSPAYDLMSTVLHMPQEEDTALALFGGDTEHVFYQRYDCYGRAHFEELADRLDVVPKRAQGIIETMLSGGDAVTAMVEGSFLSEEAKERYLHAYRDKVRRFAREAM